MEEERVMARALGWGALLDAMFLDIASRWPKAVLGVRGGLRETSLEVRRGMWIHPCRRAARNVVREGHPKHR